MKKVLIVAAHPDDEVLGMGATIHKLSQKEVQVFCLFMTDGTSSREVATINSADCRRNMAKSSSDILGMSIVDFLDFPDNKMDSVPLLDIVKEIEFRIDLIKPDTIFTHHYSDLNIDHRITLDAVLTASRPVEGNSVNSIYSFEVPSATGWYPLEDKVFQPNVFVEVSESNWLIKERALKCYEQEMRSYPHPRSIEAINHRAHYWGGMVGVDRSEVFKLLREIKRI
jgi:LmbE family N-acetylglucosaminyl deacetylase